MAGLFIALVSCRAYQNSVDVCHLFVIQILSSCCFASLGWRQVNLRLSMFVTQLINFFGFCVCQNGIIVVTPTIVNMEFSETCMVEFPVLSYPSI